MKRKWYRRKRTWLIIVLLLLTAPVLYAFYMQSQFTMSDKEINDYFNQHHMQVKYKTYQVNGRAVFYAEVGSDTLPTVIFIHGAPGSWYDYIHYLGDSALVSNARLIALDRPGYGNSGNGSSVTSIQQQADMIAPIFDSIKNNKPIILLGHSFGGPIAVKLASQFSSRVTGLVLLAPAIDPNNEKIFWVNKPASSKMISWAVPKPMRVANEEKMSHVSELKQMEGDYVGVRAQTMYMYGDKDMIVPPVNVEYAKKMLVNAPLEITEFPDQNHFIPWTKQDTITKVILKFISE